MKKLHIAIGVLCLLLASACFNELSDKLNKIDSSNWNPELAVPLINGDFTMGDLANELSQENLTVEANSEGVTTLIYQQPPIVSQTAQELITFDGFDFNDRIELGIDLPSIPGVSLDTTINTVHRNTLTTNEDDNLYRVNLKEGNLSLSLNGTVPATGGITIVFHSLIKDGQELELVYDWTNTTSQSFNNDIDLSGYQLDLSEGNTKSNQFVYSSEIQLHYEGQGISASDGFNADISINNLSFELLEGNLTNRSITADEEHFRIGFSDEITQGDFYVAEPAFHLTFRNSIGAPIQANIEYIIAESRTKGSINLTGDITSTPINLLHPSVPGNYNNTELTIDETNSNLPDIIAFQSDSIRYAVTGTVNPDSNNDTHFVTDTSRIMVDVITEVPLNGYINRLLMSEIYDFDGSFAEDVDNGIVHVSGYNTLPVDARIQAYFVDEANNVVDSLIYNKELLLSAAISDSEGNVDNPTNVEESFVLDRTRLAKIEKADRIRLVAILNTPDSPAQSVKFFEKNKLNIKLSAQTKFNLDF